MQDEKSRPALTMPVKIKCMRNAGIIRKYFSVKLNHRAYADGVCNMIYIMLTNDKSGAKQPSLLDYINNTANILPERPRFK